jgi:UDP-2,4-diacetamido-2,4,6-trideoxy-beta-L-altropyranose hydrolase
VKVAIRTDASLRIGTGHVMRCLTLAKALVEKGAEVRFMCRDHQGNLINKIQTEGFKVYSLIARPGENAPTRHLAHSDWLGVTQQQDANDCQPILEKIQPDWLIVDHYAIDQAWQKQLKPYCRKLMVIDDLGDRNHDCDLLLDQNYGSTIEKYQNRVPKDCTILVGPTYALLRPEFAQWREISLNRRAHQQEIETLLVTMGGVDPDNYTGQVLQQLNELQLTTIKEIIVVMGATAPHLKTVEKQAQTLSIKTNVKTNVNNMAEIMANADLAIGAAGATTWERCCLGLPTIQLVIAENQREIANALAKDHIVLLMDDIQKIPGLVIEAKEKIANLVKNVSNLVDGLGCERVVNNLIVNGA